MAYASVADLKKRFDVRTLGDLASDDGTQVASANLPADENVLAALDDASGEIDSAVLVARRYTTSDLTALTGNSLAYLKRLPVHELKIDRSFVMQMADDENDAVIVRSTIDLAHNLGLQVVAEGIETERQIDLLAELNCDVGQGYFISPTLVEADSPQSRLMCEEIFGPVLTVYRYPDQRMDETLAEVEKASPYALTGAIFCRDRAEIKRMSMLLRSAAGNFYINDKPTGAVVGQQPFGGGRASGTNDKAGSIYNLVRWMSPRVIKETFAPPQDFPYPHMGED